MSTYNRKLRRGLMLAGVTALPFALAGCFPSSSSDKTTPPNGGPIIVSDFKVDFMEGAPEVTWGAPFVVTAFRPGQASYEYLSSGAHPGAVSFSPGSIFACATCHAGDSTNPPQVGATFDEDPPVPDVETVNITVQAAYDADNFYLQASWQSARPGITHGIRTYRDGAWVANSTAREPDTELDEGEVFAAEDRFGLMFMPASQNISVGASFHTVGCFATCHADMDDMPEWNEDEIEVTKYLVSGTPALGTYGTNTESNAMVSAGTTQSFPDMWHWRGGRSAAVQNLTDGFVMDSRAGDTGSNVYVDNVFAVDPNGKMYDAQWMAAYIEANFPDYEGDREVNAFPGALWAAAEDNAPPLATGGPYANAVDFDPDAANFQEGDILPRRWQRVLEDSRSDVAAYSAWEDGVWTVIFVRARDTENNDDHVLAPDVENYTFAFSVFQDHTQHRWHHVTLPVTLGISGTNIVAASNN
jgi:hypothetical protein